MRHLLFHLPLLAGVALAVPDLVASSDFYAYYTKVVSQEPWEAYSRTGKYADIVVHCAELGDLVFWRGSSYLPYWQSENGRWYLPEIVARQGDGDSRMPDRLNRYAHVRLIEVSDERAIVHWRYMPDFSHVSWSGVVDEYFVVTPGGRVTRSIRQGTAKIDDWRDSANVTTQVVLLKRDGIEAEPPVPPKRPSPVKQPVAAAPMRTSDVGKPVAHWRFDEGSTEQGDVTKEALQSVDCTIAGPKSLWKRGASGTALAFDGYHSAVILPAANAPALTSQVTLEAWVALGAYPFEWAPVIHRAVWDKSGYYFGLNRRGCLGLHVQVGEEWHSVVDSEPLGLFRWYHVAATFDGRSGVLALFVDGKERSTQKVPKGMISPATPAVVIGLNSQKMPAVEGRVRKGKWPSLVGFDGLIDELKIHDVAMSPEDVRRAYTDTKPTPEEIDRPDLMRRRFPANPENRNAERFGAAYTRLDYYDTWDNMWRVSEHADVVVRFDLNPVRFVFWRGLSYGIGLVTENGKWAGDQSSENYKELGADQAEGCCEHMSDKQCRHAHVRIVENTAARVVVHWRYGMVDSRYIFPDVDKNTGWGDWADEYWTIYPDAVGVRHLERGFIWADSWVETMFYSQPGTKPEDNVELAAYTLVNLKGEKETYSWEKGSPDCDLADPIVSMINTKSKYRPFNVYPSGSSVETFPVRGRRRRSPFHWWNHYPVSQITSDGRAATAADRAAHSSLVWGNPSTNTLIYGLTDKPPERQLPLARSWNTPPALVDPVGCQVEGYRPEERAYHLVATASTLSFKVFASEKRPLLNPCFVVKNWRSSQVAQVLRDGVGIKPDRHVRQGIVRDTTGKQALVLWIEQESEEEIRFSIARRGR